MTHRKVLEMYSMLVGTYLTYRLGSQIAEAISESVLVMDIPEHLSEREAFLALLTRTRQFQFQGHNFLDLVLEPEESEGFYDRFLDEFDMTLKQAQGGITMQDVFREYVAPDMEELLGKELTERLQNVYLRIIDQNPGMPPKERFRKAMMAVYQLIPDVWTEEEFQEKILALEDIFLLDTSAPVAEKLDEAEFTRAIKSIIIPDLAEILGHGKALETVIESARKKTKGLFTSNQERFAQFVNHVLLDDFIVRIFDSSWIESKRDDWISSYDNALIYPA